MVQEADEAQGGQEVIAGFLKKSYTDQRWVTPAFFKEGKKWVHTFV